MSNTAIFYGSTSGNTEAAAEKIKEYIGEAELVNVNSADAANIGIMLGYSRLEQCKRFNKRKQMRKSAIPRVESERWN